VDPEFLHVYRSDRPFVDALDEREHEERLRRYRRRARRARVALYTALVDHYDTLMLPEVLDPEVDLVCFTDGPRDDLGAWTIRPIPWHDPDPIRRARYVKTHPHVLLEEYDVAVWVDANVLIRGDCQAMVNQVRRDGRLLGLIQHPRRTRVAEEADFCVAAGRDDAGTIERQMSRYRREGVLEELFLPETNFMVLLHQEVAVRAVLAAWWAEISAHSRRDQLSCGYALRAAGVEPSTLLAPGYSVRNHPDFALMAHGERSGYRIPSFVTRYSRRVDPRDRAADSSSEG
jgi:hypothetical protein